MSNKTCGECKHYIAEMYHCEKFDCYAAESDFCDEFEPAKKQTTTNGDRIRQGGDEALMLFKKKHKCDCCVYIRSGNCTEPVDRKDRCADGLKQWLNAPADCVKQNENHDTQTDLCCNDEIQKFR